MCIIAYITIESMCNKCMEVPSAEMLNIPHIHTFKGCCFNGTGACCIRVNSNYIMQSNCSYFQSNTDTSEKETF